MFLSKLLRYWNRYWNRCWDSFLILSIFLFLPTFFFVDPGFAGQSLAVSQHQWKKSYDNHDIDIKIASYSGHEISGTIELDMAEGWLTYWKNPGDAGFPLRVNAMAAVPDEVAKSMIEAANPEELENTIGLEKAGGLKKKFGRLKIFWSLPQLVSYPGGLVSHVYKGRVVFPFLIRLDQEIGVASFVFEGNYAVCKDICIPYELGGSFTINRGYQDTVAVSKFNVSMEQVPTILLRDKADALLQVGKDLLTISFTTPKFSKIEQAFIYGTGDIIFGRPSIFSSDDYGLNVSYSFDYLGKGYVTSGRIAEAVKEIVVKTDSGNYSIEEFSEQTLVDYFSLRIFNMAFLLIFLSAVAGGFILNFMPCVLPAVSLKLFQIERGGSVLSSRSQFGFTILGIFIAFIVFGTLFFLLQSLGYLVGWGFHFQQPYFVLLMLIILSFMVFVQFGYFDIWTPGFIQFGYSRLNFLMKKLTVDSRIFHIIYGFVVTLLATPCTAPFLSIAVAYALGRSFLELELIFCSIALGLSLPYIIFSFVPPRFMDSLSGAKVWGSRVRILSIVLLLGSILWLMYILLSQLGFIWALFSFAFIGLFFVLTIKKFRFFIRILLLVGAFTFPLFSNFPPSNDVNVPSSSAVSAWHDFDEVKIAEQLAGGKTVFIDVTADWCITCKFNEWNVLDESRVRARLAQDDIYAMRGDITLPDKDIMLFIRSYGRAGVPFYLVLKPDGSANLLGELLTVDSLLQSLD